MRVIVVTGGAHADVGKGCASAILGRAIARSGRKVDYRKLEPCLQGPIEGIENRHFGEIVLNHGCAYDGDVARAEFYIPGYVPRPGADLSLARAVERLSATTVGSPAPRLSDLAAVYREALSTDAEFLVVEIGGTAGEPEHGIVCGALHRALGTPALHIHVTTIVRGAGGRATTKPAQLSLERLLAKPDLVAVRLSQDADLSALEAVLSPGTILLRVDEDGTWPERAWHRAFLGCASLWTNLGVESRPDTLFAAPDQGGTVECQVVDDGAGPAGYASLVRRLAAWSGGRVVAQFVGCDRARPGEPVVRVGEANPPAAFCVPGVPFLEIVPVAARRGTRDPGARPDWEGTADAPAGAVAVFVEEVLAWAPRQADGPAGFAYDRSEFAQEYLKAARLGKLRDHAALDPLVRSSLPSTRRLRGARILDLGCGDGRWAARLLAEGAGEVVGVEASDFMADAAAAQGLRGFSLVRGRVEDVAFDGTFDHVLAVLSLDHVADAGSVVARCVAAVRPHGRVVIAVEHPLRTAPLAGPRWCADGPHTRAGRVRDYIAPGWRWFTWFEQAFPVAVYHRPFEVWLRVLREAGLDVVAALEPTTADPADGGNPRFVLFVAERRGPRTRLVVIDGPSASGKTTLGDAVAGELGWVHVDTGRVARAFALRERDPCRPELMVEADGLKIRVRLGGRDVTSELGDTALGSETARLLRDPVIERDYDALVHRKIAEFERTGCVVTARGLGRDLPQALVRSVLDTPPDVREARGTGSLARDEMDRSRGRLQDADPGAVRLDGARPVTELAERLVRLARIAQ